VPTENVDLTRLVWNRLTPAEREAPIDHLIETGDQDALWEAMAIGTSKVAEITTPNGQPRTAPAKRAAKATAPAEPNGDAPKRRGRPPGSKNRSTPAERDAVIATGPAEPAATPEPAMNPFNTPFTETLRNS
jgi:septal ring-binding cell division protein DamX